MGFCPPDHSVTSSPVLFASGPWCIQLLLLHMLLPLPPPGKTPAIPQTLAQGISQTGMSPQHSAQVATVLPTGTRGTAPGHPSPLHSCAWLPLGDVCFGKLPQSDVLICKVRMRMPVSLAGTEGDQSRHGRGLGCVGTTGAPGRLLLPLTSHEGPRLRLSWSVPSTPQTLPPHTEPRTLLCHHMPLEQSLLRQVPCEH